jgi:hypothetical protein
MKHLLELLWPKKAAISVAIVPRKPTSLSKCCKGIGEKPLKKVILPAIASPALFAAGPNLSQVDGYKCHA